MEFTSHPESVVSSAGNRGQACTDIGLLYSADIAGFERFLLAGFDSRTEDLLRLALYVYTLDRLTRRDRRSSWSYRPRDLRLVVPVSDVEFWRTPYVHRLFVNVLDFLSDDHWDLDFRRSKASRRARQAYLHLEEHIEDVLLFSGGLDSVAGAAAYLSKSSRKHIVVTVLHQSAIKRTCSDLLQALQGRFGGPIPWARLRTSLVKPARLDQQEPSQRCRTFLFVAAGIAAALAKGAERVLMFESGSGAINVPFMAGMATGACTTKSSHPYFLRMMSELASLMGQRRVNVELPHSGKTKGELVRMLADLGLAEAGARSLSCAHLPRRSGYRQCGLCAACITRRHALALAGIREAADEYEYDIFTTDPSRTPPEEKLGDLKAVLGQVLDFEKIGPSLFLTPQLRQWLLGTKIIANANDARPWLEVLWRYHREWIELANAHRYAALPWAGWLIRKNTENYANAAGF